MTDEELARALCRAHVEGVGGWGEGAWLAVARRARELLAAPALPAEPPAGFVRATLWAATGENATDPYYGAEGRDELDNVAINTGLVPYRLSRVVVDLPLLEAPAEVVGRVEP